MKTLYFLFCSTFLLFGCEKVIKLDASYQHSKLVLNGIFYSEDSMSIYVTKSENLQSPIAVFSDSENVQLAWYKDGVSQPSLKIDNGKTYGAYDKGYGRRYVSNEKQAASNAIFSIELEHETLGKVIAQTQFPSKINIDSCYLKSESVMIYDSPKEVDVLYLTFTDPSEESNYYQFHLGDIVTSQVGTSPTHYDSEWGYWEYEYNDTIYVRHSDSHYWADYQIDPILMSEGGGDMLMEASPNNMCVFNDDLINGQTYTLRIIPTDNSSSWNSSPDSTLGYFKQYNIELRSITADYYYYCRSVDEFMWNDGDPFSEPVQIYSNVEGGLGIVAACHRDSCCVQQGVYPMEGKVYIYNEY